MLILVDCELAGLGLCRGNWLKHKQGKVLVLWHSVRAIAALVSQLAAGFLCFRDSVMLPTTNLLPETPV